MTPKSERGSVRLRLCPLWTRCIAAALIPLQIVASFPSTSTGAIPSSFTEKLPAPVLTPLGVKVNRTVPKEATPWFAWVKWGVSDEDIFREKVLGEALVPAGGKTSGSENKALLESVRQFAARTKPDDAAPLEAFLMAHPKSPWRVSLWVNLGDFYYQNGRFSKAIASYAKAWGAGEKLADENGRKLADKALGELGKMYSRTGKVQELDDLMSSSAGRPVGGPGSEGLASAKEGLWKMKYDPGQAFHCGPLAMVNVRKQLRISDAKHPDLLRKQTTRKGFALSQLNGFSKKMGMDFIAVKAPSGRLPGAEQLPAVVHWKLDHYAAILKKEGDRYLIQDPTFETRKVWMTSEALLDEASGNYLISKKKLPLDWKALGETEASEIVGKGTPPEKDNETTCEDEKQGGGYAAAGMPYYKFHAMVISLHVADVPVKYTPPVGPSLNFKIMYNQRDQDQPAIFSYTNFGPKWTMDLIAYVEDDPSSPNADTRIYRIGGARRYPNYNTTTHKYDRHVKGQDVLEKVSSSPIRYERLKPNGGKEVYSMPDGSTAAGRKVFLSEIYDPQGNKLTLHYDSLFRLVATEDAVGQVSTITYGLAGRPYVVTRITDPFGRFAQFSYNDNGQLSSITDAIGLTSSFSYGPGDFINALTTPYGTTRFTYGEKGAERWLEAVDPLGDKERIEFRNHDAVNDDRDSPIPNTEAQVPSGISSPTLTNEYLSERNTFYWDKKAMKLAPGDYTKARITHWLHLEENFNIVSGIPESRKNPYESRVWYTYPGQIDSNATNTGMVGRPKTISRILPDGTTQKTSLTYNANGKVTNKIDPETRNFTKVYDSAGFDMLEMRQTRGSDNELLGSVTYNGQHKPLVVTNAAGQTTTYAYNAQGQVTSVTNAKGEVTTSTYDSLNRLEEVERDIAGSVTTYTYDGYNRVRTATNSEGYTLTYDYDALNRLTMITYPDGSFSQRVYDKLDLVAQKARDGRITRYYFNPLRQLVLKKDPSGGVTNYEWCKCGALQGLIDPKKQVTRWTYNEQGQMTSKIFAGGLTETYTYDLVGRLASRTDSLSQVTSFTYFKDGNLKAQTYSGEINPTPDVSFTYSQNYNRITSMTDGSGTTSTHRTDYEYYPITSTPSLGAGSLKEINGSLSSDVIDFSYDEVGRVIGQSVNGSSSTFEYDALGRLSETENALGVFSMDFVNETSRKEKVTYPNGIVSDYGYYPNVSSSPGDGNGDMRMESMAYTKSSAAISSFNYSYNLDGSVSEWNRQVGSSSPDVLRFSYDAKDRLLEATDTKGGGGVKQYSYSYDPADNRSVERVDALVKTSSYNGLNQLLGTTIGGSVRINGTTNEEAAVEVNGVGALSSDGGKRFEAEVSLPSGPNTVNVSAEDPSGNVTSKDYEIAVSSGSSASFSYDANGNLVSDGSRTYAWDAENRLVKITYGTYTSDIEYDGRSRRTRILEKNGSSVLSDKRFIWIGNKMVEQRNGTSTTAVQRYFAFGVMQGSSKYFYTKDHLGSIREVVDNSGTIVARYDYDPYGRRTKISGAFDSDFGFTGYYYHAPSGLQFSTTRAYSGEIGRFLSRDPIAEAGGINLYAYCGGDPVNHIDPEGTQEESPPGSDRPLPPRKDDDAPGTPQPSIPLPNIPVPGEPPVPDREVERMPYWYQFFADCFLVQEAGAYCIYNCVVTRDYNGNAPKNYYEVLDRRECTNCSKFLTSYLQGERDYIFDVTDETH